MKSRLAANVQMSMWQRGKKKLGRAREREKCFYRHITKLFSHPSLVVMMLGGKVVKFCAWCWC